MSKVKVFKNLRKVAKNISKPFVKHGPTILAVTGTVGVVAGTVLACKASTKLKDVLEETKAEIEEVKATKIENPTKEEATKYTKAIVLVHTKRGWKLVKLYGLAATVEIASLLSLLMAFGIIKKRYTNCVTELLALEETFRNYRKRVVDEYGDEADTHFLTGIREVIEEAPILDKNGNPKTDKNGVVKMQEIGRYMTCDELEKLKKMPHIIVFDEEAEEFDVANPDLNYRKVHDCESWSNTCLRIDGHLWTQHIRNDLGLPETDEGQDNGWIYEDDNPIGENRVSFGRNKDGHLITVRRDDGVEVIVLKLNDEGYIRDRVFSNGSSKIFADKRKQQMAAVHAEMMRG